MNYNQSYIGLRKDIIKYIIGESNKVLDVGCALGVNGKYLLDNNIANEVVGIEFDEKMAQEASKHNSKMFCGDLNDDKFVETVLKANDTFDYILFGDILEHLLDPQKVLTDLKSQLKKNGKIIISLPNIAHVELFIQVFIKGSWPNNERGIFDKTHLRWFTRKDVFSLAKKSSLEVITYERIFRSRDAIGSKFDFKAKLLKFINKDLVTFQHIIVCKHA
jgi:2-polyprenyl-3-methyl-5-hydroxy-6-metoxy-1,4-benzoquinol methylase